MEKLEFLLYVDKEYVETVYKFYYSNIVGKVKNENKNGKMRLGLATKLFKDSPVNIDVESGIELEKVSIIETQIKPEIEDKIRQILMEKYNDKPISLSDLVKKMEENGIYYFQGTFELLTIENKKGKKLKKKEISDSKGLLWKLKYVDFVEEGLNINMSMGGDKIRLNYHHLTEEIKKYKQFTFNIMGKVTKHDEKNFSIKPIVIFYV